MHNRVITLFSGIMTLLLLMASPLVMAENSTKFPGYTIHHNALTTDILTPEIASSYHIRRSKNRALVNVSVLKDTADSMGTPVHAIVRVSARYLTGHMRPVAMREIREGKAIYYIGDLPVAHNENLTFIIEVIPRGEFRPYVTQLSQEFFVQ